jgi:GTP-binding protein HflX
VRSELVAAVHAVLQEIGADECPQLEVYNKIDLIPGAEPRIDRDEQGKPMRVWCSAMTEDGLSLLLSAISDCLVQEWVEKEVRLAGEAGDARAALFEKKVVLSEINTEEGISVLRIKMTQRDYEAWVKRYGYWQK